MAWFHVTLSLRDAPSSSVESSFDPLDPPVADLALPFPAQVQTVRFILCRTMTAICFVCNLPILSHQVGLIWQGGNGWDDLVREQVEESTLKQRLGMRRHSVTSIPRTKARIMEIRRFRGL
jgi:hypothetical protein